MKQRVEGPSLDIVTERCPDCGYGPAAMIRWAAEKQHKKYHRRRECGVPLPAKVSAPNCGVLVVPANDAVALKRLAYEMADAARMEMKKDVASFEYPTRGPSEDWDKNRTVAYLAVRDGHAVGYLVTRLRSKWGVRNLNEPFPAQGILLEEHEARRICLDLAFVANNHRRQGIGSSLIRFVADYNGVSIHGLVHVVPFTPAGRRLAERFSRDGRLFVYGS